MFLLIWFMIGIIASTIVLSITAPDGQAVYDSYGNKQLILLVILSILFGPVILIGLLFLYIFYIFCTRY